MKHVAVILSGCGVFDGAEIHESVLTLLALDKAGAKATVAAPDIPQFHVVNHQTGEVEENETRNVRVESARIARGAVSAVRELNPDYYDAVLLPGGFGAAKNLSSFASEGADCGVEESVAEFLKQFHATGKPIGFACISPAIAAKLFGSEGARLTIGTDSDTAAAIEKTGATHVSCPVEEFVVDEKLKIVSTPAYMLGMRISEVETGITKWVNAVLEMTN
ncbi:MAG: isoprenoid biosynthesis glyoxalase ElbB [Verrucomicrobiae bacterium]|nr:isoprenoid biosynthesis glyoxalase ElbB [Verrucomicrobiae bacterium]